MTSPKNKQPLVTILMPIYNVGKQEDFLAEAINSILAQTHSNWELICIDDKSSDNTATLLQAFMAKDKRIKYTLNQQAKGIAGALNTGIGLAQGEYIARMDSDDISHPERLAKQVSYLASNPNRIAVGCELNVINAEGQLIGLKKYSDDAKFLRREIFRYLPMPHPAMLVRASILKQCRYPTGYPTSEDVDLFFQLLQLGELGNVQEPLYSYRISNRSNSFKQIKKSLYYTLKARLVAIKKYHYLPSISGLLYTLLQASLLLLPAWALQKLYFKLRIQTGEISNLALFWQLVKYGLVGVMTVLIDIATFTLFTKVFGINYLLADVLDTPIFLTFNYFAHKLFTFVNKRSHRQTLPKYVALVIFNQIEALALLWLFTVILGADPVISKALQTVIQPLTNFALLRLFVFVS